MKFKELIKSYGFWTALAGAMVVLVQSIGRAFGITIENTLVSDIIMAIAGVLVVFGVVAMPKPQNPELTQKLDREEDKKEEDSDSETK